MNELKLIQSEYVTHSTLGGAVGHPVINFRKRHKRPEISTTGNLGNYSLGKHEGWGKGKEGRISNKDLINKLLLTSEPLLTCPSKTKRGKISNEVRELLEIIAPAPIDQEAILSESSDTEESESDLEESDLDSE
ncbi:hypothetical protein AVEN_176422-1 [Araneus ventricosus]|uniref:Uncharacterized protein n=1 Tax=Araneus ventricosus TaxID=182803 RepID=A0A4Y2C8V5_ARAVE|nr:hypothetical protein AVEN_176422-1 [Araneus ventricosus]